MEMYGYQDNESVDKQEGVLTIYAHEAASVSDKLSKLLELAIGHLNELRPDVQNDRLTILCSKDSDCEMIASEIGRRKFKAVAITAKICKNDEDLVLEVWEKFFRKKIDVVVINTDIWDVSGFPFGKYFMFADASFRPEVFSEYLNLFYKRKNYWYQDVHVDVIVSDDDPLKSLETLKSEIEIREIPVPEWLSLMISKQRRKRSQDSDDESSSSKRPKTIFDLKPDKDGFYHCPKYLLRIPNEDGDYSDDDEEYELQDDFEEEEPPLFD